MGKFAADVSQLIKKTEDRLRYVALMSIQDVVEAAQQPQLGLTKGATSFVEGKIPVAEGELRGSLVSSLMGGAAAVGPDSFAVVLSGYEVGDSMSFNWTARHSLPMELGFTARNGRQIPGRFFVTRNAERFPSFVAARVAEANAR